MTTTVTIEDVTKKLGEEYKAWKAHEKSKNDLRQAFFDLVNTFVGPPASQVIQVYGPTEGQVREKLETRYPAWDIQAIRPTKDNFFEVELQEKPEYMPFKFANPEDGMLYARQVSSGSPQIDDEALKEAEPELYEAVTYEVTERRFKDFDELDHDQLARLQTFVYEGRPTIKLASPRKAKPEELES